MQGYFGGLFRRPITPRSGSGRRGLAAAGRVVWLGVAVASGLLAGALPESGFGGARERDAGVTPTVQRFQLLNGLRIVLQHRQGGDRLVVNLLIRSGSTLDPVHRPGLARLSAHRLLVRTPDDTKELEVLGIELQVDVQPDATILRFGMPARRLRTFLDLLGAALAPPLFEDKVATATTPVKDDSPRTSPDGLAHGRFRRAIFGDHPYGAGSGTGKGAEAVLYGDLDEFRRRHYIPNDASLIVVGAIPGKELLDAAREKLGPWTKGDPSRNPAIPSSRGWIDCRSSLWVRKRAVRKRGIVFGHRTPRRSSGDFLQPRGSEPALGRTRYRFPPQSRLSHPPDQLSISRQSGSGSSGSGGCLQVLARVPEQAAPGALMAILESM